MQYTINNGRLELTVDTLGAEIMNLKSSDGTEYIWQGDPNTWKNRSPVLFPFIGRLTEGFYQYRGQKYPLTIHGFAASNEFTVVEQTDSVLTFELRANDVTLAQYPFNFVLRVIHELVDDTLAITYSVTNLSNDVMPYAIGGHPGIRVPLVEGEKFEDYDLIFSQVCQPTRINFTDKYFISNQDTRFELEDGVRLPLRHDLFNRDAIVLMHAARELKLASRVSGRGVKASYPDMPYIGFWHWPKSETPYVCIEPWSSLPSRQDIIEEFTCKSDMLQLAPGATRDTTWTITVF